MLFRSGPLKGRRGPFKRPRGPFKGPRGPLKGPRGPVKGPRGPLKGPRNPLKGPRVPLKKTPGRPRDINLHQKSAPETNSKVLFLVLFWALFCCPFLVLFRSFFWSFFGAFFWSFLALLKPFENLKDHLGQAFSAPRRPRGSFWDEVGVLFGVEFGPRFGRGS